MKNFDLLMDSEMMSRCTAYRISRSSNAYSYFLCEYKSVDQMDDGSIVLPANATVQFFPGRIAQFWDRMSRRDHSIRVPVGAPEQLYFRSEYSHSFTEDMDHNMIVPEDEYPRTHSR